MFKHQHKEPIGKKISREAQEKIDALVEEAKQTLEWAKEMKKTWPKRKAEKERMATKKKLVEAIAAGTNE